MGAKKVETFFEQTDEQALSEGDKAVWIEIAGLKVLVDREDVELIKGYSWSATKLSTSPQIITRAMVRNRRIRTTLGKVIMGLDEERAVMRAAGSDKFDYRKECLRHCTMTERMASGTGQSRRVSKYKGVSLVKRTGRWRASIRPNGLSFYLGEFDREEDAARAYNKAALFHFGPKAFQNKIDDG